MFFFVKIVAPLIIPFTFGDEPAYPGDSNAVQCLIMKGDLPLRMQWSMNGRIIRNGENGINIVQMSPRLSSLSIVSLNGNHRGSFQCIASNAAGTANFTAELLINGINFNRFKCFFF